MKGFVSQLAHWDWYPIKEYRDMYLKGLEDSTGYFNFLSSSLYSAKDFSKPQNIKKEKLIHSSQGKIKGGMTERAGKIANKGNGNAWSSSSKYVGETANAIDSKYPGRVQFVDKIVKRPDGTILKDFDIELDSIVIQVKSGTGKGLTTQMKNTSTGTGKIVIGYTPDLNSSSAVVKGAHNAGYSVLLHLKNFLILLEKIKERRSFFAMDYINR